MRENGLPPPTSLFPHPVLVPVLFAGILFLSTLLIGTLLGLPAFLLSAIFFLSWALFFQIKPESAYGFVDRAKKALMFFLFASSITVVDSKNLDPNKVPWTDPFVNSTEFEEYKKLALFRPYGTQRPVVNVLVETHEGWKTVRALLDSGAHRSIIRWDLAQSLTNAIKEPTNITAHGSFGGSESLDHQLLVPLRFKKAKVDYQVPLLPSRHLADERYEILLGVDSLHNILDCTFFRDGKYLLFLKGDSLEDLQEIEGRARLKGYSLELLENGSFSHFQEHGPYLSPELAQQVAAVTVLPEQGKLSIRPRLGCWCVRKDPPSTKDLDDFTVHLRLTQHSTYDRYNKEMNSSHWSILSKRGYYIDKISRRIDISVLHDPEKTYGRVIHLLQRFCPDYRPNIHLPLLKGQVLTYHPLAAFAQVAMEKGHRIIIDLHDEESLHSSCQGPQSMELAGYRSAHFHLLLGKSPLYPELDGITEKAFTLRHKSGTAVVKPRRKQRGLDVTVHLPFISENSSAVDAVDCFLQQISAGGLVPITISTNDDEAFANHPELVAVVENFARAQKESPRHYSQGPERTYRIYTSRPQILPNCLCDHCTYLTQSSSQVMAIDLDQRGEEKMEWQEDGVPLNKGIDAPVEKEDWRDVVVLDQLEPEIRDAIESFLDTYYLDNFSTKSNPIGRMPNEQCDFSIADNIVLYSRPYSLTPALRQVAQEIFEDMLDLGICKRHTSPHSTPYFLVAKTKDALTRTDEEGRLDKKLFRIVLDLRHLNQCLGGVGSYYMDIRHVLDSLVGAEIISILDISSAFHSLELSPRAQDLCTIITPFGLSICMTRLPFGISIGPMAFSTALSKFITPEARQFMTVYADDIVVYTKSQDLQEHRKALDIVMRDLKASGIRLQAKKCKLFQRGTPVKILGFEITGNSISLGKERRESIIQIIEKGITTVKHVQQFLGTCQFIRSHLPDFAAHARHLTALCSAPKNAIKVYLNDTQKAAVSSIARLVAEAPALGLQRFDKTLYVSVDSSTHAYGAIVFQLMLDDKGKEVPVVLEFISKVFPASVINSKGSSYKEILGLVLTLETIKHRVAYSPRLIVNTDYYPLMTLTAYARSAVGSVFRRLVVYLSSIVSLHFRIIWSAGTSGKMILTDMLSRAYILSEDSFRLQRLAKLNFDDFSIPKGTFKEGEIISFSDLISLGLSPDIVNKRFGTAICDPSHLHPSTLSFHANSIPEREHPLPLKGGRAGTVPEEETIDNIALRTSINTIATDSSLATRAMPHESWVDEIRCSSLFDPNQDFFESFHTGLAFLASVRVITRNHFVGRGFRALSPSTLISAQDEDPVLARIKKTLLQRGPSPKSLNYAVQSNGLLIHKHPESSWDDLSSIKACLPKSLTLLAALQGHLIDHPGASRLADYLKSLYFGYGIYHAARLATLACKICLLNKKRTFSVKAFSKHLVRGTVPNQIHAMDHLHMEKQVSRMSNILTVVDTFSMLIMASPVPNNEASHVVKHLKRTWALLSAPAILVSDNAPSLIGGGVEKLCQHFAVIQKPVLPRSSSSNLAEIANKALRTILRSLCAANGRSWVDNLNHGIYLLNSTKRRFKRPDGVIVLLSPFEIHYGRELPFLHCQDHLWISDETKRVEVQKAIFSTIRGYYEEVAGKGSQEDVQEPYVRPGDPVLLLNYQRKKQQPYYLDTIHLVVSLQGDGVLVKPLGSSKTFRVNLSEVKKMDLPLSIPKKLLPKYMRRYFTTDEITLEQLEKSRVLREEALSIEPPPPGESGWFGDDSDSDDETWEDILDPPTSSPPPPDSESPATPASDSSVRASPPSTTSPSVNSPLNQSVPSQPVSTPASPIPSSIPTPGSPEFKHQASRSPGGGQDPTDTTVAEFFSRTLRRKNQERNAKRPPTALDFPLEKILPMEVYQPPSPSFSSSSGSTLSPGSDDFHSAAGSPSKVPAPPGEEKRSTARRFMELLTRPGRALLPPTNAGTSSPAADDPQLHRTRKALTFQGNQIRQKVAQGTPLAITYGQQSGPLTSTPFDDPVDPEAHETPLATRRSRRIAAKPQPIYSRVARGLSPQTYPPGFQQPAVSRKRASTRKSLKKKRLS